MPSDDCFIVKILRRNREKQIRQSVKVKTTDKFVKNN